MGIDPGLTRGRIATAPKPAPLEYLAADPYRAWAKTMFFGALIACIGFMIEAAWGFAVLSGRVRSSPPQAFLRAINPYFSVLVAALQWVGIFVLTIDDPIPHDRRRRVRAAALRLLATGSLLGISAYMFRLIENRRAIQNELFLSLDAAEFLTTILLWLHLRWISSRLALRGVQVRAIITMLGYACTVLIVAWPRLSNMLDRPVNLSNEYLNLRSSMIVIWSTVAALVMARFSASFRAESRTP